MSNITLAAALLNETYNMTVPISDGDARLQTMASRIPVWILYSGLLFFACVVLVGLPGNIVLLLVMCSQKHKSSTDVFVSFLAGSDILSILTNIPVHIITDLKEWPDIGSNIGCKIHYYLYVLTFTSSELLFAVIGLDRYLKIFHARKRTFLERRAGLVSSVLLIISLLVSIRRAVISGNDSLDNCRFNVNHHSRKDKILSLINSTFFMIPPLLICFCYCRIILRMRKVIEPVSSIPKSEGLNKYRSAKLLSSSRALILMSALFLFCTVLPSIFSHIIYSTPTFQTSAGGIISFVFSRLYYINVCINPYIFYVQNSEFRKKVKALLKPSVSNVNRS